MVPNYRGRSWTEISLETIKNNYRIYKENLPEGTDIMAVVKADAYGHGDQKVAKIMQELGCRHFAVSNIHEALRLCEAHIQGKILILGYTPPYYMNAVYVNDITQAIPSEEYAQELLKNGNPIRCHFAIDTGMNRIGLNADDPEHCERIIRKYADKLNVTGLFTHLCVADSKSEDNIKFTQRQIEKFRAVADSVSDLGLKEVHCLNSAGGLWHKGRSDCVRLGIVLYGLKPDYGNTLPEGIQPALNWKSVVAMIKDVLPGEDIGYGRTFHVDHRMRVATIPTGYADGYSRLISNKGFVLINGRKAPVVGRVCMDQFMVDITDIQDVTMGSEVVLIGKSGNEVITADDMAQWIGTIGYEVVCGISSRVERTYID